MKKYTKNQKFFIDYVMEICKKNNIKCSLRDVKYVKISNSIKCAGFFDAETRLLVVSMNRSDWQEILVHEYSHLTQWLDKIPLWDKAIDSLNYVDLWLSGKNVKNIDTHLSNSRDLELDNEKRSVKNIKKFRLDVDIDTYVKKANAYVLFYNWLKHSRSWSKPNNSPYKNKKLLNIMSIKFNMNYKTLTPKIKKIFEEENI